MLLVLEGIFRAVIMSEINRNTESALSIKINILTFFLFLLLSVKIPRLSDFLMQSGKNSSDCSSKHTKQDSLRGEEGDKGVSTHAVQQLEVSKLSANK